MSTQDRTERTDVHRIRIDADAAAVFARLQDVARWPEMFEPTIHACELSRTEAGS